MLARARAHEVSHSCTRSRGRDLIKARREAWSFVAQRPPATCPLHTALCETGECRIRVAWLVFTSDERNAGSRGRNKRLSIEHVNSFRHILSVYTTLRRRRDVSVKYLTAFTIGWTKWLFVLL